MIPHRLTQCQSEKVTVRDLQENSFSEPRSCGSNNWQRELSQSKISAGALLGQLNLSPDQTRQFLNDNQISSNFPLRATQSYINRIEKGDPDDPLLRQILPLTEELIDGPGFSADPLNETNSNPSPGIIHKYRRRALLIVTQACAIHCRYCFRRHFPYQENTGTQQWQQALEYLRNDSTLNEVILSGGDPLSANDLQLARLSTELAGIRHIERLRIHTRMPVVLPARIDNKLLGWLEDWPGSKVIVIHSNHPNELNNEVAEAVRKLRDAGATVLNQSVLLRGVNDHAPTLALLSEKLFDIGVLPYYLHQLDPVSGATHFEVDDTRAREIIAEVSAHLSGYLVPRLVREKPGAPAKQLL